MEVWLRRAKSSFVELVLFGTKSGTPAGRHRKRLRKPVIAARRIRQSSMATLGSVAPGKERPPHRWGGRGRSGVDRD